MVIINLLPWRAQQQAYQKKKFKQLLWNTMIITFLLLTSAHLALSWRMKNLNQKIVQTKQALQQAEDSHPAPGVSLVSPPKAMVTLQNIDYRQLLEKLLLDLGQSSSAGVCFTSISQQKNVIVFAGLTRSLTDLTDFLTTWQGATLFSQIVLKNIQPQKNHLLHFEWVAEQNF